MLKGISRRVIVVKSPDRRFFEEAIFIVKEGAKGTGAVTSDPGGEEARRVADWFVKKRQRKWFQHIPATGYMILGAVIATIVCCLTMAV